MHPTVAQARTMGVFDRLLGVRLDATNLFAAGLLVLLGLLVGVPLTMVILMSLRTGFPGEGGALTLTNFINIYTEPGTFEVLLNTLFFAIGAVAVTLLFAVPLVWLLMRTDLPF
ncbi:MAG: hypothetical protein ACM37Z_17370, partial [Deltaproteobacteria bacterium]